MSIELVLAADKIETLTEFLERCLPIVEEMASMMDDEESEALAAEIKEVLNK